MCLAAKLGVELGVTPADVPGRIQALCASLGLPTHISCTMDDYTAAIGLDKKGAGTDISLIALESIGRAAPRKLPKAQLLKQLEALPGL